MQASEGVRVTVRPGAAKGAAGTPTNAYEPTSGVQVGFAIL
jgi:hypothetical protein